MTNLDEPTHGEYDGAVQIIKAAILRSQYAAARSVNEEQLKLYFGIGKYISLNSRKGFWGKGAIDAISEQLQRELPGLRGFSARNLRNMRTFYEEWSMLDSSSHAIDMQLWAPEGANIGGGGSNLAVATAKLPDESFWQLKLPKSAEFPCPQRQEFHSSFRQGFYVRPQSISSGRIWRRPVYRFAFLQPGIELSCGSGTQNREVQDVIPRTAAGVFERP